MRNKNESLLKRAAVAFVLLVPLVTFGCSADQATTQANSSRDWTGTYLSSLGGGTHTANFSQLVLIQNFISADRASSSVSATDSTETTYSGFVTSSGTTWDTIELTGMTRHDLAVTVTATLRNDTGDTRFRLIGFYTEAGGITNATLDMGARRP